MRNTFAKEITRLAKDDENIVLLSGDIGNRMFDEYKKVSKGRFINCGIAEANMMSVASGLGLSGMKPYVYTITPFTTCRCLEQIKIGAAYHNANITIIGTGSGLSYSELGPTHHSLEDMGILSCIPNIRILAPCDSIELRNQLIQVNDLDGPTYIRIGKKGEPNLHKKNHEAQIGKASFIRESFESDILVIGVGPILSEALEASKVLEKDYGINISIASLGGLNPLDLDFLENMIRKRFRAWVTLEEHGLSGGLASTINNWIISSKTELNFKILNICTPNEFLHNLGNQDYVRNTLGIDRQNIVSKILGL